MVLCDCQSRVILEDLCATAPNTGLVWGKLGVPLHQELLVREQDVLDLRVAFSHQRSGRNMIRQQLMSGDIQNVSKQTSNSSSEDTLRQQKRDGERTTNARNSHRPKGQDLIQFGSAAGLVEGVAKVGSHPIKSIYHVPIRDVAKLKAGSLLRILAVATILIA